MVATSSTAAEYMALSGCARDCAWYKTLLSELGKPIDFIPLYGDSRGAIFNAQNPVTQKGIKHIEIRHHYIQEQIELGTIKLFYVPTLPICSRRISAQCYFCNTVQTWVLSFILFKNSVINKLLRCKISS
jgi:hypothetical protein